MQRYFKHELFEVQAPQNRRLHCTPNHLNTLSFEWAPLSQKAASPTEVYMVVMTGQFTQTLPVSGTPSFLASEVHSIS